MKLAFSILCEHPGRKTGLTTFFHSFVSHALPLYPDVSWIIYAGPAQEWDVHDPRVEVVRIYPANDRLARRLLADHLQVPADARRRGATALLTVGFVPVRKPLPVVMHLFSMQHLSDQNRVGFARQMYRRLIVNRSVDRAELIIVNSRFAESQFLGQFPDARPRTMVSYEGLQHDQFTPAAPPGETAALRAELGLEPGYVLWVSNFYEYKQADRLLAAYARLSAEIRQAHPLVMVGGGWHGGLDAARAHTASLGIAEDVRFLGWIDDRWLAPLYRHARLFCLASREETFGKCVSESMACGTPCVVNHIPIMDEVTGGHALIVDYHDAPAVAAALETLLTDDALHARLRAEGMAWVARFNFDKLTTERIEAILATLGHSQPALAPPADNRVDFPPVLRPYKVVTERLKLGLRALVVRLARLLGSPVVDQRTGQVVGRAMIVAFRGKVHLIGLDTAVRPVFLPQKRLTYWKQEMGFTTHPAPDFPHEPRP